MIDMQKYSFNIWKNNKLYFVLCWLLIARVIRLQKIDYGNYKLKATIHLRTCLVSRGHFIIFLFIIVRMESYLRIVSIANSSLLKVHVGNVSHIEHKEN